MRGPGERDRWRELLLLPRCASAGLAGYVERACSPGRGRAEGWIYGAMSVVARRSVPSSSTLPGGGSRLAGALGGGVLVSFVESLNQLLI